ncbi:MAG: glycosyl hydrolase family 18 protein [Lachnospiraceae bacterium]|nr:glycosyl hydrolase family 18 protein [Lachnospiraceae bacterium]
MKIVKRVIVALGVCVVLGCFGLIAVMLWGKYSDGKDYADLDSYFSLTEADETAIILDNTVISDKALLYDGGYYFSLDTIQDYFHNRFYYTELSREIRYTDAQMVVAADLDGTVYSVTTSGETTEYTFDRVIAFERDGVCYINADFVFRYVAYKYEAYTEPNRIVVSPVSGEQLLVDVKKNTAVRWRAGIKSDILKDVTKGEALVVLDADSISGWTKVATLDGFIGYIKNKCIGQSYTSMYDGAFSYTEPEYTSVTMDAPVRLGFQAVYTYATNDNLTQLAATASTMNVVAPTWFTITADYEYISFASVSYVEEAHAMGLQVWGLLEDITYDVDIYYVLADSTKRTELIDFLIEEALRVDMDGINIDLESVRSEEGAHFIQFLRELSIRCREEGLILSVDNYPPNSGNTYNDYKEQGVVADYVILMGYDEHWGGSGDPGSTASQSFVEDSLDSLMTMVDASKIVLAVPFYTRLWVTQDGVTTDSAVYISDVYYWTGYYGMEVTWDEETGQNYAEATINGALYQMWIEDSTSLSSKLQAAKDRGVAGVAAWRLGYEDASAWSLIGGYFQ